MEKGLFTVQFKSQKLVGDIIPPDSKPSILILHGSGKSNRLRYDYIRLPFGKDGIATCAFDFIGHGQTGGDVASTSLEERTKQAQGVIDNLKLSEPLGLLGGSMGAYTAIKLTEIYNVDRLVLAVPAIYSRKVYKIPFGKDLTKKLREKGGWKDSDAWDILRKFKGRLLIVVAGKDNIISPEISKRIYESASKAKSRQVFTLKDAEHQIREYLIDPKNSSILQEYLDLVRKTLVG